MVEVNCKCCSKVMTRRQRTKRGNYYCNTSCQMTFAYEHGLRNKFQVTKKANQTLRAKTQERFDNNESKTKIGKRGYRLVYLPKRQWVKEHHWVWEQKTGKTVPRGKVIHHINHDRLDNRFENLMMMSFSEHSKEHYLQKEINELGQFM